MSKTVQDLEQAFAGESQANRKYLAFAKMADQEGFKHSARLFRAAAEAETIHAHTHLKALGWVKSTRENLEAAIAGELFEFEKMYPPMIKEAEAEGNSTAIRSFKYAHAVEEVHAGLFKEALAALDSGAEATDIHVCGICGHTVQGGPPEKCPVCSAGQKAYKKID